MNFPYVPRNKQIKTKYLRNTIKGPNLINRINEQMQKPIITAYMLRARENCYKKFQNREELNYIKPPHRPIESEVSNHHHRNRKKKKTADEIKCKE